MSKYLEHFYDEAFWKDINEAKRLKDSGLKFCEIVHIMHKPYPTLAKWVRMAYERNKTLQLDAKNPEGVTIRQGIRQKFADELRDVGIKTVGEARVLCSDDLSVDEHRRRVIVPGKFWEGINCPLTVSLDAANAVRGLLGADLLDTPVRRARRTRAEMDVEKAVGLLESLGYRIVAPKNVSLTSGVDHS